MKGHLHGKWLKAHEDAMANVHLLDTSRLDGFTEVYAKYIKQYLLVQQNLCVQIGINQAAKMCEDAQRFAIVELKSSFKDRNSLKAITAAVHASSIMYIPGSKAHTNGFSTRYINIVLAIRTFTLSTQEVDFLCSLFTGDQIEYDADKSIMTLKCYELALEGVEPNTAEQLLLTQESRMVIPAAIIYIKSRLKSDISWRDHFIELRSALAERIIDMLQALSRKNWRKNELDEDAIAEIKQVLAKHTASS
ncbi:hypothetical protein ABMX62_20430 [Vibrio vulnificus]|uniref:hypothetical protein n=1 Tax=Vibrio vulnificus TaxID=672 RepID=UPI0040582894